MRSKKNYLFLLFLVLFLCLGVGYAVVNSVSLSITGTAGAGTADLKVSFNGTKTVSNSSKGTATVTAGSKSASFTASNLTLNETITYTYTVQNTESDVVAYVSLTTSGSNSYFTVNPSPTSFTIQPGSTAVVTVEVKMIKTPVSSSDSSASFTVSIKASPNIDSSFCCFDPNMRVLMADGTYKKIVDVEVGDMVMSLDEETGEYVAQRVKATIIKKNSDDLVYVHLSNGTKIGMRAYHPLLTTEGWKSLRPEQAETVIDVGEVQLLEVGDTLVGIEGNLKVVAIEPRPYEENYNTYNLSIENTHNYIVEGVVVHNASDTVGHGGCTSPPVPS